MGAESKITAAFMDVIGEENVRLKEPLSLHTTFRIGGAADFFLEPENERQLIRLLRLCRERDVEAFLIGNGSNLLVSDEGYHGAVISLQKHFREISVYGQSITAEAGVSMSALARKAAEHALSGLAFASGIPGTVGGGVMMNAGAYGGEIAQVCRRVRVLDSDGAIHTYDREEMNFSYRYSRLMEEESSIVLSAEFFLETGDEEEIYARMADYNSRRREKQPLEYPSAGSTFKRPEGYFAGKLIQDAGLKGYRVGGMEVSEKHSGFVINRGKGTAADAVSLINDIRKTVKEAFGVTLEPEVRLLGFTASPWR